MIENPIVFLDYGELIFHYDFNRETLERAHKLAFQHISSRKEYGIIENTRRPKRLIDSFVIDLEVLEE